MGDKITVSVNGVEIVYDVLFTVLDEKEGNQYVIYTDNKLNSNGEVQIYLNKYKDNNLMTISDNEKKELEKLVKLVQAEVCNEN